MKTPTWQRWAARTVLVTFSTCVVACGGSSATPPTTTTVPSPTVPATAPPPPPPMPPAPPPTMPPAPPAPSPTIPAQPPEQLGKQDLQKLVAPIALYPDVVLGSLLPATTFPEQIHDAAAYVGTAARVDRVPEDRGWDGSIIGLMQFPDVLRWLDDNPAWTDEMGQAVTFQQADVLQAIQDYRKLAMDAGNLKSNQYQTVQYVENAPIRIEPAHPDVVYVPSYDAELALQPQPAVVYPGVNPWIMFGAGAAVGALGAFALYSIFDDDYHHGGGYHINHYNNYYYSRGRRPAAVGWTARERAWHARPGQINHPRRLEYRSAQANRMGGAPLHPPVNRPGEMRQDRQLQKQENRMDRQQQQRDLRQQHQQQRFQQRQQQQQQRQEHQQQQRDLRQQHQQQQRDMREQHQQQKRDMRQQHQQQRIENRPQQQHQQHQENRQMHQEQHQQQHGGGGGGGGHGGGGENKKKQHH